jgi:hypothetical protein
MTNIAYFHGLESKAVSDKSKWIEGSFSNSYIPTMNYNDPGLFNEVLREVKDRKIDLLVGSSMGGWFAYCISTLTGISTILFNPALHSRSMNPTVKIGNKKANHTVILGKNDNIINPEQTVLWTDENGIGNFTFHYENFAHRTPITDFRKWVNKIALNESTNLMTYSQFLKENKY